jgi:hypothetical protein
MKSQRIATKDLAGIEYMGIDGITSSCISAVTCLLNGGRLIRTASLVTCATSHAFLLTTEYEELIAVKAGFRSGYSGEGPRGLATVLKILRQHAVDVKEYLVEAGLMHRLAHSCLLQSDLDFLLDCDPVRPNRWYDYIHDQGEELASSAEPLSRHYPMSIPFGLIDPRIIDLAVAFGKIPDAAILAAYRRLEDIVRKRTQLSGEGVKLFSKAFSLESGPLRWDVPDEGELKGRANLFNATYMGFRNARAHREIKPGLEVELREFLLVNELYRLEAAALTEPELRAKRDAEEEMKKSIRSLEENRQEFQPLSEDR